ncbi:transcriptional regulator, partial [Amycolatopsis sp. SID8362]|nr:transcriptional regulator [Amycolatopsis sp. SID8362]NED42471.1 transcriptional regulator [Amycolatopsis sp. SID8362]
PPRAIVEGSTRWTHPLGRRQADLLRLIAAAGPAGVSAAQLSETVYGDRTHLVTVRAELSRLRKLVGGLLLARPYRIAPGVEVVLQP